MTTILYPVLVHSCLLQFDIKVKTGMAIGEKYLASGDYFRLLPDKCQCRKKVTLYEARQLIETGRASPIYKYKHKRMEPEIYFIWMAQQAKVPRIDLISKADIERAYTSDDPDVAKAAMEYIEEVHLLYMENRAKLIVPFRPDPTEGRLLFSFSADYRTFGGVGINYRDVPEGIEEADVEAIFEQNKEREGQHDDK